MARWKATVSYDGSNYAGWQKQANAKSIQAEIEEALYKINEEFVEVVASGRTDAHVHALAQVFHFDAKKTLREEQWVRACNSMLPKDIRILKVEKVEDSFHARFDAICKRYDYYVTSDVWNPFLENYMGKDRKALDVEYMQDCAKVFLGTHDFTSFTSSKIDERKSRIKTIYRLDVIQESNAVHMIFEGNAFLRYMVRMLAQVLIEAGKHRLCKEDLHKMLLAKDKHVCRYKASPNGLYLVRVDYSKDS